MIRWAKPGTALAWNPLWILTHPFVRGILPERRRNWRAGLAVGSLLADVGIRVVASQTFPAFLDRSWCKRWARAGEHLRMTIEGHFLNK